MLSEFIIYNKHISIGLIVIIITIAIEMILDHRYKNKLEKQIKLNKKDIVKTYEKQQSFEDKLNQMIKDKVIESLDSYVIERPDGTDVIDTTVSIEEVRNKILPYDYQKEEDE